VLGAAEWDMLATVLVRARPEEVVPLLALEEVVPLLALEEVAPPVLPEEVAPLGDPEEGVLPVVREGLRLAVRIAAGEAGLQIEVAAPQEVDQKEEEAARDSQGGEDRRKSKMKEMPTALVEEEAWTKVATEQDGSAAPTSTMGTCR